MNTRTTTRASHARGGFSLLEIMIALVILALATALRFYFVSWLGERTVADIREAVQASDLFVFLLTPAALRPGAYTLTEVECARAIWRRPHRRAHRAHHDAAGTCRPRPRPAPLRRRGGCRRRSPHGSRRTT